jgi:excisionase family DNA binding protein
VGGRRVPRAVDKPILDLSTHASPAVTVAVLAGYLECDDRTVTRMIESRTIWAYKVGREWRIPTREIRRAFHGEQHQQAS